MNLGRGPLGYGRRHDAPASRAITAECDLGRQPGSVTRAPDGVKWPDADHFSILNKGDDQGGSRGWPLKRKDGTAVCEGGASLEQAAHQIGHYPEKRSRSKGV